MYLRVTSERDHLRIYKLMYAVFRLIVSVVVGQFSLSIRASADASYTACNYSGSTIL